MRRFFSCLAGALLAVLTLTGCGDARGTNEADGTLNVVATTSMIADLVRELGGDAVTVTGLMGPGVDPHLYKASEGDVARMSRADVVVYNGLHLEGKMTELFEQMQSRVPTVAVAEGVPEAELLTSADFTGNYDPHIWFDVTLWEQAARRVAEVLAAEVPAEADAIKANLQAYLEELETVDAYARERAAEVPEMQRVLVTSHDAFGYFGRAYGFEVEGLQGISTATEAGTADVQRLAELVAERRIPALFVESSVSPRGIEAVQAAVRDRGFDVQIGGTLYGDALGGPSTGADTYLSMVRSNIDTIVDALTQPSV